MDANMIYSPRNNLIMTKDGLKCVSKIEKGELILTYDNKFIKVEDVNSSILRLSTIIGHGHPKLMLIKNQPLLTSNYKRVWNKEDRKSEREFKTPILSSDNLKGDFWLSPSKILKVEEPIVLSEDLTWLIGAFLSGGYIKEGFYIYIRTNEFRYKELEEKLERLNLKFQKSILHAFSEYYITNKIVVEFLNDTFNLGYGVYNMPLWIYGMDEIYRKALFEGFMWNGGIFENNKYRISTGNKSLAIGIKLIAQSLGYSVALYLNENFKDGRKIERWQVICEINARSSVEIECFRYSLIRDVSVNEKRNKTYKIELEDKANIYIDGIAVGSI